MNSDSAEKFFNEVPNTAAAPIREKVLVPPNYEEALNVINKIINNISVDSARLNKSGKVLANGPKITDGAQVIEIIITCYIQSLRYCTKDKSMSEEEVQDTLIAIKNYETALNSIVTLQKNLNLKLDCNSVTTIIHGAVTELMKRELQND